MKKLIYSRVTVLFPFSAGRFLYFSKDESFIAVVRNCIPDDEKDLKIYPDADKYKIRVGITKCEKKTVISKSKQHIPS